MDFSHLTSAALSDIGRKRNNNEDAILQMSQAGVFGVADGMGGAAGGELASCWTMEAVQHAFENSAATPRKTARVRGALNDASRRIKTMAADRGILGAGTTAIVLFFDDYQPDLATILHAGDSRAYRIRDGLLERLTLDHSLATSAGLSHDSFLPSMFRGVITRAVGLDNTIELDEGVIHVKTGDCYLLCSDGLTKMISDSDIQNLIHKTSDSDLARLAAAFVDAANRAGGEDNISVILIRVGTLPAPVPRPTVSEEDLNTTDKVETVDAAIPIGKPNTPESQAAAGTDNATERHSETADVLIGVTPQTPLGSTPTTPTATRPLDIKTAPAKSIQSPIVKASARCLRTHPPPSEASSPSTRRYLLIIAGVIVLPVVIIILLKVILSLRTPGRSQQPDKSVIANTHETNGSILDRIQGDENIAQWTAEQNKAFQVTGYATAALKEYQKVAVTLCTQAGLVPPPTAPDLTAQTTQNLADIYCIQLFDLQQFLRAQIKTFVSNRSHELAIFGKNPTTVTENIRRLADLPAPIHPYPFASLQHDLNLVATWLAEDRQRLIPLDEIQSGPPSILPRTLKQRNELWSAVLTDIKACSSAIEQRRTIGPNNHLLNNIASLQQVIIKTVPPNRDHEKMISWPNPDNLPTLEGFFSRVDQYLNNIPVTTTDNAEKTAESHE